MKHLLLTTIAAVVLVGCGPKPPDISIHDAAFDGNIEAVKQHLAAGTDVNVKAVGGATPLGLAATGVFFSTRRKEIVELLIAEGADVNAKDEDDETPLDWAIDKETAALLRKHGGKTGAELNGGEPVAEAATPEPPTAKPPDISIHDAVEKGNIEAVKQHIAAGTDVNAKTSRGETPLYYAVTFSHKEVVELLIAEGADVNAKGKIRNTPLHYAAYYGYKEIVELLIAKGADVNAKTNNGNTPLDEARRRETVNLLRKHGGKTGEELKAAEK